MVANQYLECRYNKTFRQLQNYKKVSQKNNCSPKRIVQNSIRGTLTDFKLTELATDINHRLHHPYSAVSVYGCIQFCL